MKAGVGLIFFNSINPGPISASLKEKLERIMNKCIMFLGLMMVSTVIFAQQKADPRERATKNANKMKSTLALTDEQYNMIKAIDDEYGTKQTNVSKDSTLSKESRHQQMRALQLDKASAIDKVLTNEQKSRWATARSEQVKKHRSQMKKSPGEHAQHMQKKLSLSDEQTSKIKAIDEEFASKFHELRKDSTMAREDSREKAKSLRKEYRSKTKAVLTEEQFQRWETQKSDHRRKKF
ncbi:MAG TPA: hypothetical protein VJ184_00680 [Chryseolinea sp.]|nr:hypothetical protein [Chryseolinea sp.]